MKNKVGNYILDVSKIVLGTLLLGGIFGDSSDYMFLKIGGGFLYLILVILGFNIIKKSKNYE